MWSFEICGVKPNRLNQCPRFTVNFRDDTLKPCTGPWRKIRFDNPDHKEQVRRSLSGPSRTKMILLRFDAETHFTLSCDGMRAGIAME